MNKELKIKHIINHCFTRFRAASNTSIKSSGSFYKICY